MAKKSKKVSRSKPKKAKVNPIPKGFGTVTPYLTIDGAAEALEWYKKALGAKELFRETVPGGKIMHARIRIGDSIVMLNDYFPGGNSKDPKTLGSTPVTLHVYTKNVDKLWQQAIDAGATVNMPLDNQFWGERYGQLKDPFGHNWSLSMVISMSKKEKKEKQDRAMAMFSQGAHPGAEEAPEQAPMAQQ
jgi:PhnB protein